MEKHVINYRWKIHQRNNYRKQYPKLYQKSRVSANTICMLMKLLKMVKLFGFILLQDVTCLEENKPSWRARLYGLLAVAMVWEDELMKIRMIRTKTSPPPFMIEAIFRNDEWRYICIYRFIVIYLYSSYAHNVNAFLQKLTKTGGKEYGSG